MKSAASLETPGMRHGAGAPTMPAASRLPCGAHVSRGLAELASLKQLRALIRETLRSSAAQRGRPPRTAHRASEWRNHPERIHGVGAHAPGGPLRHRRAAERRADQGSQLFERNAVERVLRDPACREQRRGAAKRPVTSARRGHGPQRRSPLAKGTTP